MKVEYYCEFCSHKECWAQVDAYLGGVIDPPSQQQRSASKHACRGSKPLNFVQALFLCIAISDKGSSQ